MLRRTDSRRPLSLLTFELALLLIVGSSCRSAEDWAAQADEATYALLEARREGIATGEVDFSIEPPVDTLRAALLEGTTGTDAEAPLFLNLVECMTIGAENSRTYRSEREDLFLSALDLTLEHWRFSIQESGTISGTATGRGSIAQSASFGVGAGLSKLFGIGAQMILDVGVDLARVLTTGDPWEAISGVSFSITQPLLRGFGRTIVQEPLTQAERNVVYAMRDFERFRRTFGVDVANRYFRILSQRDTLGNEERNFDRLEELRIRNEDLALAGRMSEVEVAQSQQEAVRARDRVIQARQAYEASLDDFKLFLGIPITTHIELALESGLALKGDDPILSLLEESAVALAEGERLDYLTTVDRFVDAQRRVRVSADSLRAGLNLRADTFLESPADQPERLRAGSADSTLRLDFDLPVNLIPERNSYRRALVQREVARRAVEEASDRIRLSLRDLRRELDSAAASLAIQEGGVLLAERRVEGADLSLQAGRANTRDLLEARAALIEAQNQRIRQATDLTLAGLDYLLAIERLRITPEGIEVEREGLDVPFVDSLEADADEVIEEEDFDLEDQS